MRIVFLLSQDLESPSGLGRYWPLGKALFGLGHQVTILALHPNFTALTERQAERAGVVVQYVGQMHVRKVGNEKSYFDPIRLLLVTLSGTWELVKAALRTSTDVYHLCKPHPMNGLAGVVAGCLYGKPVYLDCDDYEAASNRFTGRWQRSVVALFEDWLPKLVRGVTVNTRFLRDRLVSLGVADVRIVYVPNGVDRQRFGRVQRGQISDLKRRWGLQGKKVIIYVGSMSLTNHPVDLLLSAFSQVAAVENEAVLLLVGGGEDLETLREQVKRLGIEEAVHFTGRVSADEVPAALALADVSVDPVRDDDVARSRCPLKVFESLAVGTPVVTGDVGDRSALLASGGGLLALPGSPEALAEALITVLRDRALRSRLSAEALAARERYYWDKLVHDFVPVYGMMT